MKTNRFALTMAALMLVSAVSAIVFLSGAATAQGQPQETPVEPSQCFDCHAEVQELYAGSKHSFMNCVACHDGLAQHLDDPSAKPQTNLELTHCGKCHSNQYDSFMHFNIESKARVEKGTTTSRSPEFDKLMMPHAFTKEHAEPRSHAFMLIDHLAVDRAYGGRFEFKDWQYVTRSGDWREVLVDTQPDNNEHKAFKPQTAFAANPTCLTCKTTDHVMKWKYKGEPAPEAKWSRVSNVVDFARDLKHPMGCIHCHDPHGTQPRVVRDALIEAVVDRGEGTYPYDQEKSQQTQMRKVIFRDGFRAIGLLSRADSNLMCAQCHVEYNCNPGHDPLTGEAITKSDSRSNMFPWSNVLDYNAKMEKFGFKDFKHAVTGASLSKIQHPETEVHWGSKHERAGVECKDCHMPSVEKGGKTYTWHGQKSARYMTKDTCVACHNDWSEEEAVYQIDAIQNYTRGKMRKAEFWLGQFIDTFQRAKDLGVDAAVLADSRKFHNRAHTLWEWWTAENSDGFHNPSQARESLTLSVTASQEGVKFLEEAIARQKAGGR